MTLLKFHVWFPLQGDRDVDFTLNCSGPALLNITYKSSKQEIGILVCGFPVYMVVLKSKDGTFFKILT